MDFLGHVFTVSKYDFLLSTVSSPSDYDTAPDVMESVETAPAEPRSERRLVLLSELYF